MKIFLPRTCQDLCEHFIHLIFLKNKGQLLRNGDVLTHYEARRRIDESGCLAVMVGRGALIKPWCAVLLG
jgi:hypothetical protein